MARHHRGVRRRSDRPADVDAERFADRNHDHREHALKPTPAAKFDIFTFQPDSRSLSPAWSSPTPIQTTEPSADQPVTAAVISTTKPSNYVEKGENANGQSNCNLSG